MIPESFIQELLNRVDVVEVVDRKVQLKKAGANFVACCPFHKEKTPSFSVSPSKQFYHCFGCGAHGSAISFLIEYDGMTFVEAVNELANTAGLKVPNEQNVGTKEVKNNQKLEQVMQSTNIFFQKQLRQSNKAIAYLKERGLTGQIAKEFAIGYAPEGWSNLEKNLTNYDTEDLIKAGLIQKNEQGKFYDRFRDRIMFPIINEKGVVIGFGGRVINPEDTPKYYNSPETPLFQKSFELYGLINARKAIRTENYVLVVEGYMDVAALAQHDIRNVVATLGTATTQFHIKKLMRYTQEIVFCFDGDQAGKEAAWRALNNALEALNDNLNLKFLFLPDNHDPDSYVRENSKEAFTKMVDAALPFSEYLIKYLTEKNNLASQEKKVKFLNEVEPILKKINASKLKLLIRKKIAALLDLDTADMNQIFGHERASKGNVQKNNFLLNRSQKRKFCLLMLLEPNAIKQDDAVLFVTDELDDQLGKAIVLIAGGLEEKRTANIMYALESRFDADVIRELNQQLASFDMNLDYHEELVALSLSLHKKGSSKTNLSKLDLLKEKSISALSAEERSFLQNMRKKK
ncbi:MAG: DNA primase [Proteobacteria bacterium]|jgi:DNA primase|nr:DNA primase [Pseudomonadota bacterium]MDA0873253.1 DNA primase [Pseudomonadota bacterium]